MKNKKRKNYLFTIYACYLGLFVQAILFNICPLFFLFLSRKYHLSFSQLGFLVVVNFVTQILADLSVSKSIEKYGYRIFTVLSNACSFIGLGIFAIAPFFTHNPYIFFIISTIIFSLGSGILEVILTPVIDALPLKNKSGATALLYSFFCWGQASVVILTSLFIYLFGIESWQYIIMFWMIFPLINGLMFLVAPFRVKKHGADKMGFLSLIKQPIFILLLLAMLFTGATEFSITQWSSTFLEAGLGIKKVHGDIIGLAGFSLMMGITRVIYAKYAYKVNLQKLLTYLSYVSIGLFFVVACSKSNIINILALILSGITMGMLWPGTIALSARKFEKASISMFAVLAAFGDLGGAIGPFFIGVLSDWKIAQLKSSVIDIASQATSLKFAFLIGTIFPICLSIIYFRINKSKK